MEKLIINRDADDFYQLEINENGDYIQFDLTDIGIAERLMDATEKIKNIDDEYTKNINDLLNDKELNVKDKAEKLLKEENKYFDNMNKTFDSFLGDGACKKIFGQQKRYGQYVELLAALEPHFKKMNINMKKAKKKLADRYLKKDSDIL